MAAESVKKILVIALGVCAICSVLVSTAAVTLHAIQEENKRLDKIKNILMAGDLLRDGEDIDAVYREKVKPLLIELSTGAIVPESRYNDVLNIEQFDIKVIAAHPEYGRTIPDERDRAGIRTMPRYMPLYLVKDGGRTKNIIIQIYGKGLWSTMYGFLAFESDLKTVQGLTFYEHGETPGLGGEIESPRWQQNWKGKKAFDDSGAVAIRVIKGTVDKTRPDAKHQVDGISGATLTVRGVDHLVQFWLGEDGYGPVIRNLRKEEVR